MKKIINYSGIPGLILISALFFLLVSCNKDTVKDNSLSDNSSQLIKVSGEDVNAATKTTLGGLVTSWVTSDKVGVYSPDARTATAGGGSLIVNAEFTAASTGVSSNFTGTMFWGAAGTSHTFYAYYPWASGTAASTVVPVSLTSAQTQSAAGNNAHIGALDFMVATPVTVTSPANTDATSGVNLKYNHVFSILEFQIKGTGELQAVKLVGSITPVAFSGGTIDITQATPATDVAYTFASQTGTTTQVVVTLNSAATLTGDNTDTKVYMVINPGTQTGSCLIGLKIGGTWTYISKAASEGGFKRGKKYVVSVDAAAATASPPVDYDGNVYNTVTIGTQVWMKENLKTTKYRTGELIGTTATPTTSISWESSPKFQWAYAGNENNVATYGRLYTWYAATDSRSICPIGWHLPSDAEWTTLTGFLGGESVAGGKLKEAGTTHWTPANTGATNSSGFTALPGGYRYVDGSFSSIGGNGTWWSSTGYNYNTIGAWYRSMLSVNSNVDRNIEYKAYGFSVRCLRDM